MVASGCGTRVVLADDASINVVAEDAGHSVRGKLPGDGAPDLGPAVDAGGTGADAATPVCTAPARRCDGAIPQACDVSGVWLRAAPCPFLCVNGSCTGVCTPGAVACAGNAPEICDGNASWQVGTPCRNACSNGACVGECNPGDHQCSGAIRQVCSATGEWQTDVTCPFVCLVNACAGVCVPATQQCVAGDIESCSALGAWQSVGTSTRELLTNPAFDAGETGWTNPGIPIVYASGARGAGGGTGIPDIAAQSPPNLAWFGGLDRENDLLSQDVALPAGAASVTFSFYYAIFTDENTPAENDVMDISLVAAGGTAVALAHLSDNDATAVWKLVSVPVPASLFGQTVTLQLRSVNNNNRTSSFYLDTLSMTAIACP